MRKITAFLKTFIITKSSLFAIGGLSIIFSFPFIVSLVSGMFVNLCKEEAAKTYGRFDNIIYDVSYADNLEKIINVDNVNDYVDFYGTIGICEVDENLSIGTVDKNAIELGNIHIVSGDFPKNNNEICMCESLYYELYSDYEIGSTISIDNRNYQIVGLINDYSAAWNKPDKDMDYLCPNVIVGEFINESNCRKILLLKNKAAFPTDIYKNQRNIVSNTNVLSGDLGEKYKAPDFIYLALYTSIIILLIYVFWLVGNRDKRNIEILSMLGISRPFLKRFVVYKYICLSIFSVLFGWLIGELFLFCFIKLYNYQNITQVHYPDNINNISKLIFGLLLCIIAIYIVFILNDKIERTKGKIIENIANKHIKNVIWLELIRDYKGILISSVITAIMLISFLIMGLYLKMYVASKGDVFGKMPVDYDYQFTTNQNIDDYSYTDSNGEIVSVISLPDEESIYYMPSHSNVINESVINKMNDEVGIYKVNNYVEANDIYLNLVNRKVNLEYISGFPVDNILNEQVEEALDLDTNSVYRNSQFCMFPESEILNLKKYEFEGNIDLDKINAGEEIILVVPVYEKVEYDDGSWGLNFIEYKDYTCEKNQYKDDTFRVGDEIELLQVLSDDSRLIGNLSMEQVKNKTFSKIHRVRIGAILYERVMWFEDASQMPTAYSFIGTEKTLNNIGFEPTYTRTQLYLENGINYRDFEPVIHKYQKMLEGFDYKNNAAEMEEYRQFMRLLKGVCYLMISLTMSIMIVIVFTETFTAFLRRRGYYTMMRIIGMPPTTYAKIFMTRIIVVFLLAVLLFLSAGLYIVNSIFGTINDIWKFLGIEFIVCEMFISLIVLITITILIYRPLLKKYPAKSL